MNSLLLFIVIGSTLYTVDISTCTRAQVNRRSYSTSTVSSRLVVGTFSPRAHTYGLWKYSRKSTVWTVYLLVLQTTSWLSWTFDNLYKICETYSGMLLLSSVNIVLHLINLEVNVPQHFVSTNNLFYSEFDLWTVQS